MVSIHIERTIAATPAAVWAILEDHENMHKWTGLVKVVRRRPGTPTPNGVGAIRTLYSIGPIPPLMEEHITAFAPNQLLEYDVVKGAPGRNAHGVIKLTPAGNGSTLVQWSVTLHPFIPGTGGLIQWYLQGQLEKSLTAIKERLEPATR